MEQSISMGSGMATLKKLDNNIDISGYNLTGEKSININLVEIVM